MPILFTLIALLGVVYLIVSRPKNEGEGNWMLFRSRGKETGFSFKEIEMLRQLTVQCVIEPPHIIFESQTEFDKCIRSMIRGVRMTGQNEDQGIRDFIAKMYEYRQNIAISKEHTQNKISRFSEISEGQALRVLAAGKGVFNSRVVKNTGQYLTISRPENSKMTANMSWAFLKIAVYFWREGDAGYVFDSEVLDEVYSLGIPSLKIKYGESLLRTQRRSSVRVKMNRAAFLYPVPYKEPPHKLETKPGLRCVLEDLSDTGYAVTVGGTTNEGMKVKVQFALDNIPVCITGTVRSTSYQEDTKRSVLRIEAEPMPAKLRNHILSEVFGMLPDDDEDELPFHVLDDEMTAFMAGGDLADSDLEGSDEKGGEPYADTGGQVSVDMTVAKPKETNDALL